MRQRHAGRHRAARNTERACLTLGRRTTCTAFFLLLVSGLVQARAEAPPADVPSVPARNWVVDAAQHEQAIIQFNTPYVRYRIHMIDAKGDQIRDVLESKDGTVARVIFRENRPLTPEEDQAEHQRLQAMLDSPAAFAKHVKGDVNGKRLANDLVKLMPDAMTYTYVPGQPQTGRSGAPEVVLDFAPNPAWNPPTMTSEALTGLRGRLWIDKESHRMVRLDAELFQGVNFGFGMIAHIFPGGHLLLDQSNIPTTGPNQAAQRWIFSHFVEHVTVRALMIKTVKQNVEIGASDFQIVPAMSYQDAIKTLLQTPLPTHVP